MLKALGTQLREVSGFLPASQSWLSQGHKDRRDQSRYIRRLRLEQLNREGIEMVLGNREGVQQATGNSRGLSRCSMAGKPQYCYPSPFLVPPTAKDHPLLWADQALTSIHWVVGKREKVFAVGPGWEAAKSKALSLRLAHPGCLQTREAVLRGLAPPSLGKPLQFLIKIRHSRTEI